MARVHLLSSLAELRWNKKFFCVQNPAAATRKTHRGTRQWSQRYHFSDQTPVEQERPHETLQSVPGGTDISGKLLIMYGQIIIINI